MRHYDGATGQWVDGSVDYGKQVPVRFDRKTELPMLDALVAKANKKDASGYPPWPKATRSSVILKLVIAAAKGLKPVVVEEKKPEVDERQIPMFELPKPKKKRAAAARKTTRRRAVRQRAGAKKGKKAAKK